jgi:hypothetical protein
MKERAAVQKAALFGIKGMIVGEIDQTNPCASHRDCEPLWSLIRANLTAVIGQSTLAVDHDQIRTIENWGQSPERMVQQRVIVRIVLDVFLVLSSG